MPNSEPIKKISAGGVVFHNGKFLLIRWKSQNTIELPKGTVKRNETLEQTAQREVLEETGYKTAVVDVLNTFNYTFTWHDGITYDKTVHYFLMALVDEKKYRHHRQENEDFINTWVAIDNAEEKLTHSDAKEAVRMALSILKRG